MFNYVQMWVCVHICILPQLPEESIEFPGNRLTDNCEKLPMCSGSQIWEGCENNSCC